MKRWGVLGVLVAACARPPAVSQEKALPHDRRLIGAATSVAVEQVRAEELARSLRARRAYGWALLERINAPVSLAQGLPYAVPAWQTWYDMGEFRRLFEDLWKASTPAEQAARRADPAKVAVVLAQHHLRSLPEYWEERFARRLAAITDVEAARSVNGVSPTTSVLFSPELVRHVLEHYGALLACPEDDAQADTEDGAEAGVFGPCFGGPFPPRAMAVKAAWRKVGLPLPVYDTSARGLAAMLAQGDGSWVAARSLDAPAEDFYVATAFRGLTRLGDYRLVGLHIAAKAIPEWTWSTFWWSERPREDFGEDRPAALAGTAWQHYKMCTATAFDENDAGLREATETAASFLTNDSTTLATAALAAHVFAAPQTICSNPYIEHQRGGARSNCLGCHQHAGRSRGAYEAAVAGAQQRRVFQADYLWSFESFAESFRREIAAVVR